MLIDKSYFTGKINIPNLEQDTVNPDLITNNNSFDRLIKEYTFKYLVDVFGFKVANEILDEVEPDGTVKASAEQKYKDLINGVDKWRGLRYEVQGVKYSQIAYYVYCQWVYENQTQLTDIGNTIDNAEKANVVNSWNKFNDAWREMHLLREPEHFYSVQNYYFRNKQDIYTLYDYISESSAWVTNDFISYENTNSFGL